MINVFQCNLNTKEKICSNFVQRNLETLFRITPTRKKMINKNNEILKNFPMICEHERKIMHHT